MRSRDYYLQKLVYISVLLKMTSSFVGFPFWFLTKFQCMLYFIIFRKLRRGVRTNSFMQVAVVDVLLISGSFIFCPFLLVPNWDLPSNGHSNNPIICQVTIWDSLLLKYDNQIAPKICKWLIPYIFKKLWFQSLAHNTQVSFGFYCIVVFWVLTWGGKQWRQGEEKGQR